MTRVVLATVMCFSLAPAAAYAYRRATDAELHALVYHASGRYYFNIPVSEPRSVPARCFVADIATVAHGWGAWAFSRYAQQPSNVSRCHTGNGIAIGHKFGGRWYVLWEGSDGAPPTHDEHGLKGVPRAVARDLMRGFT